MTFYLPKGVKFETITPNKWGKSVTIEGDLRTYNIQPNQRFVPHALEDAGHPAKIGDMITVHRNSLSFGSNVNVLFVSNVRTFKECKGQEGSRQVELLGMPCRWFHVSHFQEYQLGWRI